MVLIPLCIGATCTYSKIVIHVVGYHFENGGDCKNAEVKYFWEKFY